MVNIEKLVKKCNNNLLRKSDTNKQACNYCTNNSCPLDGKCLPSLILFIQLKFSLATINNKEINILVPARQNSKPDQVKENETELSKYIWDLKDKNNSSNSIKWSIVKHLVTIVSQIPTIYVCQKNLSFVILEKKPIQ